jgi:hypothetical protein
MSAGWVKYASVKTLRRSVPVTASSYLIYILHKNDILNGYSSFRFGAGGNGDHGTGL